jgi:hypothetical protein
LHLVTPGFAEGYSWFDHFVVVGIKNYLPCSIPYIIIFINDPEMPARRGGDRTMNNLSAAAEPWVKPMEKRKSNEPHDPEGCRTNPAFYFSGFVIHHVQNSSTASPSWNRSLHLVTPGFAEGYSWFDHFVVVGIKNYLPCSIPYIIIFINDPEMPARRGGDRTMNNLSAAAEPWVSPMDTMNTIFRPTTLKGSNKSVSNHPFKFPAKFGMFA